MEEVVKGKEGQIYGVGKDLTVGGKHTMQNTGDALQNCTLETYIVLLTNITPINLSKTINKPVSLNSRARI